MSVAFLFFLDCMEWELCGAGALAREGLARDSYFPGCCKAAQPAIISIFLFARVFYREPDFKKPNSTEF
jgi:hypothetical protein